MMLLYRLHAYYTTVRTSICATLYSLVHEMEAVMPLEVKIPSSKVLINGKLEYSEWAKLKFEQLNLISEKRLIINCHHQFYQSKMVKAYNNKFRLRVFKEGDLALNKILLIWGEDQSKRAPNYEGSYMVKKAFSGGALILTMMDRDDVSKLVNSDVVKK